MNTYVVDREEDMVRSFLLDENSRAIEIHEDNLQRKFSLGDIYIGKVTRVLKDLNAAFVDIQPGVSGYLPLNEPVRITGGNTGRIAAGSELAVQVVREPIKEKKMALSGKLTLKSPYCMVSWCGDAGVSRKIDASVRSIYRELSDRYTGKDIRVLVRTAAADLSVSQAEGHIREIREQLRRILEISDKRVAYSCLYKAPEAYLKRIGELPANIGKITAADSEIINNITEYIRGRRPDLLNRVRLYEDRMVSLKSCYCLRRELDNAKSRIVHLSSGASLVIEVTEALSVIDVNTACSAQKRKHMNREENFLSTNLEAARECARQIRLRNLSGIILIDFINMEKKESTEQLIHALKQYLLKDPVRTRFEDITKLGLVEITRMKIEKPL